MKPRRFEIAVLLLFLAIGIYQLFIPPLIGIADNGDFERMRIPNGISRIPTEATDQRFDYVYSKFAIVPEPNVGIYYFHSSTHLFVAAARWLNVHFVNSLIFDIRVLAALYMACFLLGVELILIFSREWKFQWRCLLAAALLCMFTDTAYTAYFNSFYSEPTALVALMILVGCSLLLINRRGAGLVPLAGYFAAAAIIVTAKPMYVPYAALFAPFGIYLARYVSFGHRYKLALALSSIVILLAVAYQAITPEWLRMKAGYIAIFGFILKESPNPDADLPALNLKPEWKRLIGTTPYDADSPVVIDPAFPAEFSKRVHTLTIPKFLITHPAQLYRAAAEIAPQLVMTFPDYAGYFEASSGKPARSKPRALWSSVRAVIFPAPLWLVMAYFMTGALAFAVGVFKAASEPARGLLFLYTLLVAFSSVILAISTFTMASIDTRYSSTFVIAFDLSLILGAGLLIRAVHYFASGTRLSPCATLEA